jgi:hypothetical protein
MIYLKKLLIIFICCCFWQMTIAQPGWDERGFLSMSPAQRYRFVHDYPYWRIKNGREQSTLLGRMLAAAEAKKDRRSVLAVKYYIGKISGNQGFEMPGGKTTVQLFSEIADEARAKNYEVEEVVARHYLTGNLYESGKLTVQQQYVEVQKTFGRLEEIGFGKFKDYEVQAILFNLAWFMWQLEDYENAYRYLSQAERFVQPNELGSYFYTQIMSYLQTYWKQKKDFAKSIEYTQKILQFHGDFQFEDPENQWRSQFWRGFANIEMAALLIEQGNIAESERFADEGYKLSKVAEPASNVVPFQAEYDALMVLIPAKLKLGKMDEAGELLQRADFIQKKLEPLGQLDYFKPLKLYRHFSTYRETRGDPAGALRYAHLAQALQDSLDRRNDARKLAQAQLRHEAEKFAEKLKMVENEKHLQQWLRNAVLVILLLVVVIAFGNFHRLQYLHRQKEAELAAAKENLAALTLGFRHKSELVENLRLENEKLAVTGQHSEYFEQLVNATILTDDDWQNFRAVFEKVYPGFIARQKEQFPDLTPAETRLLVLEKLGLGTAEMANMLGVNRNTINQTRRRLRLKTESEQG